MRWTRRFLILAALAMASLLPASAQAPPRYALVIGNAAYSTPGWQLANPVNDANLIATRLRGLGFQVTPVMNANKAQMEAAMNAFTAQLRAGGPNAVGVFYYAGHGVEHDGANLLVPVDVTASSMDELRYQAPPMQFLLRDVARAGNAVNIIILDACRNLPLPSGARVGPAGGLADLADVPTNVLIAYATRPGLTAPDNPREGNSVFTRTLADALATRSGETAVNLFSEVQAKVYESTGYRQRPEFRSGLLRAPTWRFATASTPAVDPELERLRRENEALRRTTTTPATVAPNQFPADPRVFFGFDQTNLPPGSVEPLNRIAAWLVARPNLTVRIVGSASALENGEAGSVSRAYALRLGERRAGAVRDHLVARGVATRRIETMSYGRDRPLDPRSTPEAYALNRNAVIELATQQQLPAPTQPAAATTGNARAPFEPEMVRIPGGSFVMGSPVSEAERDPARESQRRVIVPAFEAGKFEVMFAEWDACVADGGCSLYRPNDQGWGRARRPVIWVSWNDAQGYVQWLSRKTGKRYRLLSEAEWEYAARANTTTAYSTGASITASQARFRSASTALAGSYASNAFGLHDMHGNVWEWVEDCFSATTAALPTNGSALQGSSCANRVYRGGGWNYPQKGLRSANRERTAPSGRDVSLGFRVARSLN